MALDRKTGTSSGSGSRARKSRTRASHRTTAPSRRARPSPTESTSSPTSSRAACTPTTWTASWCGRRISATRRCGTSSAKGATPALHGNRLVIVWDHQGDSRSSSRSTSARARSSGARRARRSTPGRRRSSSSTAAGAQVIVTGHEPGAQLRPRDRQASCGTATGMTMNPIPSPVYDDGMVFLMSGFRGNNLKAIRLADAKGDITGHAGARLDARSRHAVRAVAAALRRHPLLPQDATTGSCRPSTPRPASRTTRSSGSRRRPTSSRRRSAPPGRVYITEPRGHHGRAEARPDVRGARRRTSSTTGSTRRRRSSTTRSSCAVISSCTCISD